MRKFTYKGITYYSIEGLHKAEEKAVETENYEEAAVFRDKIIEEELLEELEDNNKNRSKNKH